MPSYRSMSTSDPDIYHLDFKAKKGTFYYLTTRRPSFLSCKRAWLASLFPAWYYFFASVLSIVSLLCFAFALGEIQGMLVATMGFGIGSMFWLLGETAVQEDDPLKNEALSPTLILGVEQLRNPMFMRIGSWNGLRFWPSGDVEDKMREAFVVQLDSSGKFTSDWLLSIFFNTCPVNGQLGLAFR